MSDKKKIAGIGIAAAIVVVIIIAIFLSNNNAGNSKDNSADNGANNQTEEQVKQESTLTLVKGENGTADIYTSQFDSIDNVYSAKKSKSVLSQLETLQEENKYTAESPLFVYNAFGTNELSYYTSFETEMEAYLEYTVSTDDETIPEFTRTAEILSGEKVTKKHQYQLIGFVPGVQNYVTLRLFKEDGSLLEEHYFSGFTAELADEFDITVNVEDGTSDQALTEGLYAYFTMDNNAKEEGCDILCYDNDGIIRSVYPVKAYRAARIEQIGENLLYATSNSKFALVSKLGQVLRTYVIGDYSYHHDYRYYEPSNTLYLLATNRKDENHYVEDLLLSLNLETGEYTETIDFKDLFPDMYGEAVANYDEDPTKTEAIDWIHHNSLTFVGSDNEMIFSSRELSAVISVTNILTKPEIKYIIADEFIFKGYEAEKYLLKKDTSDGDFKYQYGQHDVSYGADDSLEDGCYYLTMYDNNAGWSHSRPNLDWSGLEGVGTGLMASTNKGVSSYFYKYLVNEKEGTFKLVDSVALVYSGIVSNAGYVGDNIVTSSGTAKQYAEYDREGNLIRAFVSNRNNFNYRVIKYPFL